MTQQEIDKAFEGRWRIKEHVFSAEDHVRIYGSGNKDYGIGVEEGDYIIEAG